MGRARGANAVMGLAFEAAYGVPPVAGGYRKMPFVSSQLGATQALIESDLLGQGRAPYDPTYDVVTNDGDVVVPLDTRALGNWLKLLFGNPETSGSAGAFGHVFRSGMAALPSASIEIGMPDRPSYSTHYGIRANTLQIQKQRSGLSSATIGLIGKGETVPALTSNAGTLNPYSSIERFPQASGSIVMDNVTVGEIMTASISYSNVMEKDETIKEDGEINDVDPGMPTCSISLTGKFADLAMANKASGKEPVRIVVTWAFSEGRTLTVLLPRVFLPRTKRPITGPAGVQQEFQAMASTSGGDGLIVVAISNDQESYA